MALAQDRLLEAQDSIHLEGGPGKDEFGSIKDKAVQVLQIELARDVVRDMKKCARGGQGLSVGFGQHLILRYGHTSKPLRATPSIFRQELYQRATPTEGPEQNSLQFAGLISHHVAIHKPAEKSVAEASASEAALNKMREQYAAIDKEKRANQSTIVENAVNPGKKRGIINGVNRGPLTYNGQPLVHTTAQPLSSLTQVPNSNQTSQVSTLKQSSAIAQAQRFALIHLLAVRPDTIASIYERTCIPHESLGLLLDQLCERSGTGSKSTWSLSPRRFKELDVWHFPYSDDDRQSAIENAIGALDKQRINPQDKLWQKLLPLDQRSKGKILSRLHLIANDHRKLLKNIEGKGTPRSTTPASHHQSEVSEAEDMAKNLQPKNGKPSVVKKNPKKTNAASTSTAKNRVQKEIKYLSSERIEDSDEEFKAAVASSTKDDSQPHTSPELSSKPDVLPITKTKLQPKEGKKNDLAPTAKSEIKPTEVKPKPENLTATGSGTKRRAEEDIKKDPNAAKKIKSENQTPAKVKVKQHAQTSIEAKPQSQPSTAVKADSTPMVSSGTKRKAEDEAKKDVPTVAKPNTTPVFNGSTSFGPKRIKGNNGTALGTPKIIPTTVKSKPSLLDVKKPTPAAPQLSTTPAKVNKPSNTHDKVDKPTNASSSTKGSQLQASPSLKPAKVKTEKPTQPTIKPKPTPAAPRAPVPIYHKPEELPEDTPTKDKATRDSPTIAAPTASPRASPVNEILSAYKQYHALFQAFKTFKQNQRKNVIAPNLVKTREQYQRLARLQKKIITGFESTLKEFEQTLRGIVRRDHGPKVLNADEAKAAKEKCRIRFVEWKRRYLAMRNEGDFGEMQPEEMERLWAELESIGRKRRVLLRSLALGFGALDSGEMGKVDLERT